MKSQHRTETKGHTWKGEYAWGKESGDAPSPTEACILHENSGNDIFSSQRALGSYSSGKDCLPGCFSPCEVCSCAGQNQTAELLRTTPAFSTATLLPFLNLVFFFLHLTFFPDILCLKEMAKQVTHHQNEEKTTVSPLCLSGYDTLALSKGQSRELYKYGQGLGR